MTEETTQEAPEVQEPEQTEEVVQETTPEPPKEEEKTPSRGVNRNQILSGKVKEAEGKVEKLSGANEELQVENAFLKEFSEITTKYPGAVEHKDAILEKVKAGYTSEDATLSVLNAEKQLFAKGEDKEVVAGGSAINQPTGESKEIDDMTQEERLEAIEKELG